MASTVGVQARLPATDPPQSDRARDVRGSPPRRARRRSEGRGICHRGRLGEVVGAQGTNPPTLMSMDAQGRVIYISSLTGLGAAVDPGVVIRRIGSTKRELRLRVGPDQAPGSPLWFARSSHHGAAHRLPWRPPPLPIRSRSQGPAAWLRQRRLLRRPTVLLPLASKGPVRAAP